VSSLAESSFSTFREIAYDRWVSPFTSAPGSAALCSAPSSNLPCSLFAGNITSACSQPRQKIQSQPPLFQSCSFTGQIDGHIPVQHSCQIHANAPTEFSGKFRTLTTAAPSAPFLHSLNTAFSHGFPANHISRSDSRLGCPAKQKRGGNQTRRKTVAQSSTRFLHFLCKLCGQSAFLPGGLFLAALSPQRNSPPRTRLAEHLREHPQSRFGRQNPHLSFSSIAPKILN
jgi:hypothetical protein